MSTAKYVILNNGSFEEAIIFPDTLTHKQVAMLFLSDSFNFKAVVSAGNISIGDNREVTTYGKSVSLGLSCGLEDKRILEYTLGFSD